jgi:histidine ammonia-lyase
MASVRLGGPSITIADVVSVARAGSGVELSDTAIERLDAGRRVVEATLSSGTAVYGLTNRLGAGRDEAVEADELIAFQDQVLSNHAGGIGESLPADETRALIFARLVGFSLGGAGVRSDLARAYRDYFPADRFDRAPVPLPTVPRVGSVGASDLTMLAAVAADVRLRVGFAENEALAAISANSYSIGVGALTLADLESTLRAAELVTALSLEALGSASDGANLSPFDRRLHDRRGSAAQSRSAATVLHHLDGSYLMASGRSQTVQDPLSFRTAPQVHGAVGTLVETTSAELERELNTSADNPLVDIASGAMISGGNFEPLGLALGFESLRVALSHVAGLSERRTAILSGLLRPVRRAGANRVPGLTWYSAAARVAEIRQLAAPVSVTGTQLSEVEDHASFAPLAVQLTQSQISKTLDVLAIEALHAVDLLGAGAPDRKLGRGTTALRNSVTALLAVHENASDLVALLRESIHANTLN